ncbi:MAG: GumC family protein, partial [Alphaproteobacteria bacterium]
GGMPPATLDQAAVASQVQLILSRDLAASVAGKLDLKNRAEFDSSRSAGLVENLKARFGLVDATATTTADDRQEYILNAFAKRLEVSAIGDSRVISIAFTSTDARLAAEAANAVGAEYLVAQAQAKRDTTSDAVEFLSSQITELSQLVQEAEGRVELFRSENDLFSSGGATPSTLSEQQLTSLNAELSRMRALRADAEARVAQIRAGLSAGSTASQTEVLNSPLIQRLVEQQIGLRTQIAQLSATLLPQHPRMLELLAQITDLDRQVATEAGKIMDSLESGADLAKARETEIASELNRMKTTAARANDAGVDLRALEREAAAQRDLLDSYLFRYREALAREQMEFLPADARIISTATVPLLPVFPKKMPISLAAAMATFILAVAIVLLRDLASGHSMRPIMALPAALPVGGHSRWADDHGVRRIMPDAPSLAPELADRVEESLTEIVSQIGQNEQSRILVTLAEGSDKSGRPLAAVALARALSKTDNRTVMIDLRDDEANAASMGEEPGLPGLSDLVAGRASFAQAIFRDRRSRVHFIPTGTGRPGNGRIPDDKLSTVMSALSMTYDMVVLDAGDAVIDDLAGTCDIAVVVSEHNAADPRTVRAFDRITSVSDASILLLVVDPVPVDEPPETRSSDKAKTRAGHAA